MVGSLLIGTPKPMSEPTTKDRDSSPVDNTTIFEAAFPEESLLSIDEYLNLYQVASTRPAADILLLLAEHEHLSTSEISAALSREDNSLHYHLRKLKQTGLIRNRRDPNTGTEETYSYYELSEVAQTVLTDGIQNGLEMFAAEEHAFEEKYSK